MSNNCGADAEYFVLKLPEVVDRTKLSKSNIYRMIRDGDFPNSVKIGARSVGWQERDINKFIASRLRP